MNEIDCVNPTLNSPLNRASRDKFVLILTLPYLLRKLKSTDPAIDLEKLQISVHGTVVPQIQVPSVSVPILGQVPNYSAHTRPNYAPLQVNFIVDNNFLNYYLLWKWLDLLNSAEDSFYQGSPEHLRRADDDLITGGLNAEYQTDLSIFAMDEYNQPKVEFVYHHAFITSLGAINYSYREGELIESTVEFQFSRFTADLKNKVV